MRFFRVLTPVLLMAVSGVAQDVRYNFASGQNFSKYKTYKWVKVGDNTINSLAEQQLTAAVDAELTRKGLTKKEADPVDLYIGYQATVGTEKQFSSYSSDWGYGPGWGGGWYGGGMGSTTTTGETTTIYVGQVVLDMYDSGQKQLVWRGTASKTLDAKAKPDKQKKNLDKAVAKLLKNYPPPVKKS